MILETISRLWSVYLAINQLLYALSSGVSYLLLSPLGILRNKYDTPSAGV